MKKKIILAALLGSTALFTPLSKYCFSNKKILYDGISNQWQQTDYVGTYGFVKLVQKGNILDPILFFSNEQAKKCTFHSPFQKGELIRITPSQILDFKNRFLPQIEHPIVLLISGEDPSFPSNAGLSYEELYAFIHHDKIAHIFAQNCDCTHEKVSHFPIGVDFHSQAHKKKKGFWKEKLCCSLEQEKKLNAIISQFAPTEKRKCRAFVDFQLNDTMTRDLNKAKLFGENRTQIFEKICKPNVVDFPEKNIPRSELWKKKGEYAFSVSPPGNGLDCHRTWEDLILGCIVIVKTSPLDPLYEGLPVVIVQNWEEVTQENLEKWHIQYADAFKDPAVQAKLKNSYWLDKIKAEQRKIL